MTLSNEHPIVYNRHTKGELRARIFNIQRYSLNDGEGIRTLVFFKGCPLACPWCSNPESRSPNIEQSKERLRPNGAALAMGAIPPSHALTQYGWDVCLSELLDEVMKDDLFFRTSKGGVTLSGGEVLMQWQFAEAFLTELQRLGVHTAIETSGEGRQEQLLRVARHADEVLYDFKIMDKNAARKLISANVDLILSNFEALLQEGIRVIARIPLIPGYTFLEENLRAIQEELVAQRAKYTALDEVHLLPFHQYGSSKYANLEMPYALEGVQPPDDEALARLKQTFQSLGFKVLIGG